MKKLLLVAALMAALSSSVMAENSAVYLRGDIGANKFTTEKIKGHKYKSNTFTSVDLGVGYYFLDKVRSEVIWTHLVNPESKASIRNPNASVKRKATIDALLLKGVVDVADFSAAKIFVDAGAGMSVVSEKSSSAVNGARYRSTKFKKKNNFCYTVGAGVGFDLSNVAKMDVQYSYTDFGKAKAPANHAQLHRNTNSVKAGVRFSM